MEGCRGVWVKTKAVFRVRHRWTQKCYGKISWSLVRLLSAMNVTIVSSWSKSQSRNAYLNAHMASGSFCLIRRKQNPGFAPNAIKFGQTAKHAIVRRALFPKKVIMWKNLVLVSKLKNVAWLSKAAPTAPKMDKLATHVKTIECWKITNATYLVRKTDTFLNKHNHVKSARLFRGNKKETWLNV